ncbi:MAG TPA: LCP family protein [Clostridiales bacterium]|nr:LCP family protein [Clostridiales bacterium]
MYREENYNREPEGRGGRRKPSAPPVHSHKEQRRRQLQDVAAKNSVFGNHRQNNSVYGGEVRNTPKKARSPKGGKGKKTLKIIGLILLLFVVLFGITYFYLLGSLDTQDFPKDDTSLGITDQGAIGVTNIAFFGVDTRDNTDTGRSDAILILSADLIHGNVKMTSILRDSKVPIDGHGETKINHAYAYGGPELAVKTLNQVFKLDIKEYATVNFEQLVDIVDAVGGVTITITNEEMSAINALMDDAFPDGEHLTSSGSVLLNGQQAICYSRIRKIDTDNARAGRQQEILNAIFESLKGMSKLEYPKFVRRFSAIVETSLSTADIIRLAPLMVRDFAVVQNTIPDENYETDLSGGTDSDGVWYWHYDLDAAAERLHSIIYEENP